MKSNLLVFILSISIFLACDSKTSSETTVENSNEISNSVTSTEIDSIFNQVMVIHDEVMPKMGELVSLKKELSDQVASGAKNKAAIESAIEALQKSDDAMMNWMRNFDTEKAKGNTEETKAYLQSELQKVKEMKSIFLSGLEQAKALAK